MAKLPERQLRGVSCGFDYRAIRFATLQECEVCTRINQFGAVFQGSKIVVAGHTLNE
jgi:hypothetical protein